MQNKNFEFLTQLPEEIQKEVVGRLPISVVYHSLFASKQTLKLLQPVPDSRKSLYDFLHAVVQGEHNKVKVLLEKDIHLLVARDQVTDCSGRIFEHISGFEYALWALDKHMWTMMLDCISKNENSKIIFVELFYQYDIFNTKGVTYKLNGEIKTEKHFNFKNTIIKALQTQVDLIYKQRDENQLAVGEQWREGVGGAQKLFPMHVVYEYCSDEAFHPVPKFILQPKSSKQFCNGLTGQNENWFHGASGLSIDFAIYKGLHSANKVWGVYNAVLVKYNISANLGAMRALCKVRIEDFSNLRLQLEQQIAADNQSQAYQM